VKNRSAHAVLFGFDFQINAAIVLMLENIQELQSVRLEGNEEDIELTLENGRKILAQAKAIENSSFDFTHVRENLKKALISLSDGAKLADAQKLILITNSPNPLKDNDSRSVFWGPAHRDYATLPPSAKRIVDDYVAQIEEPLDLSKFMIQVLPFETDDEAERYKVVLQSINDFIGGLGSNTSSGLGKRLFEVWRSDIFINGSKKDTSIQLSKKDIVWPIIVLETSIAQCDDAFKEQFDIGVYDEVVRLYGEVIDSCCERIDSFSKIIYDYTQFSSDKKSMEKCQEFIDNTWKNYKDDFSVQGIEDEVLEALTKIVLYNVIRRRIIINNVKQGVNL
jgi:hypothetical protein